LQPVVVGEGDSNRVLSLKVDPASGKLWIGTQNGAFIYSRGKAEPVPDTAGTAINAIWFDDGQTLLATDNGAVLSSTAEKTGRLVPDQIIDAQGSPIRITSIVRSGGQLFIGTIGKGVLEYKDGRFAELIFAGRPMAVNALAAGHNGELWIGAEASKGQSGIYRYDFASGKGERMSGSTAVVFGLEVDDQGLWVGTARYGLFRVNDPKSVENLTFENTSGGLRADTVFSILTDREGVHWFGTNRGVSRYDHESAFQVPISDVPNSNFIRTFGVNYKDAQPSIDPLRFPPKTEHLYAGSNRGLFTSLNEREWMEVPGLKDKAVYAIATNNAGDLLVGTSTGLFDISGKKLFDGDVRGFARYDLHMYAAVFGRGVIDITGDIPRIIFADDTVTSLSSRRDKLWIGTNGHGLYSYNGLTVSSEIEPEKLRSGAIWQIYQPPDEGPLFIAGQHGIFKLHDGNVEQIVAVEDARAVFVEGKDIWAATATRGVIHARHDDRFGWLISSIGFEQGLPSAKAFSILPRWGRFLFATNRGIVSYSPHKTPPDIIVSRVLSQRLHDQTEIGSKIELEDPQNSLLVEVAGMSSRTFSEEFQ